MQYYKHQDDTDAMNSVQHLAWKKRIMRRKMCYMQTDNTLPVPQAHSALGSSYSNFKDLHPKSQQILWRIFLC